jgi:ankyrin repeat protein
MMASENGHEDIVRQLIAAGADIHGTGEMVSVEVRLKVLC